MTLIEQALFHDGSAHWVSAFELSAVELKLTLHPCLREHALTRAVFLNPRNVSKDDAHSNEDERELPWDIIGFDADQLADGTWRFCLHTDAVEYVFDSAWPVVSKTV